MIKLSKMHKRLLAIGATLPMAALAQESAQAPAGQLEVVTVTAQRRAENIREDYKTELANHWDALKQLAQSAGWSVSRHVTDQSAAKSLLEAYQWLSADHRSMAQH